MGAVIFITQLLIRQDFLKECEYCVTEEIVFNFSGHCQRHT